MLFVYPAIFHKEDDSCWVEFPGLKGCNTYGSTISEAMEMAQEAHFDCVSNICPLCIDVNYPLSKANGLPASQTS